jgi:hypothetical protein
MADNAKQEWVRRVLGVAIASGPGGGEWMPSTPLLPIFVEAKETVDQGIGKLQDKLRELEDDDFDQIVEFGLYGATTGQTVELMAALRDAGRGGERARQRLVDAVHDYQDFLEGAPIVDLIEDNPFGVPVPLRRTLGDALKELERLATV